MDQSLRGPVVLRRDLRVLNQKEEKELQRKLNLLDKQYKYTRRMLQQRRDSLINEHRRVLMVKVCQPQATVDIAMRDIRLYNNTHFRGLQTSDGTRTHSCLVEQSRSISAPPLSIKSDRPVRHRGNIQSCLSYRQMKNIAAIDSISERELDRRLQGAREEMEKLRQFQRESLDNMVEAFIQRLKDRSYTQTQVEDSLITQN